jgi:hypothetical protein
MAHLRSYSRDDFAKDLVAGSTVGIVALPLALAFEQPFSLIQRSHFAEAIGSENIVASLDVALQLAKNPN